MIGLVYRGKKRADGWAGGRKDYYNFPNSFAFLSSQGHGEIRRLGYLTT